MNKSVMKLDFSSLFAFAEREFNISWNPCNDLFFGNCLEYKCATEVYRDMWQEQCSEDFYLKYENVSITDIPNDVILGCDDDLKSYLILDRYLESVGLKEYPDEAIMMCG